MNINIRDKYVITTDGRNFVVSEIKIIKEGEKCREEYTADKTYHGRIDHALMCVFRRGLLKSDATTLKEILKEIKDFREELQELFELNLDAKV